MTEREHITDELELITRALPVAGARLLDIGCGNGRMTRRLVKEAGAGFALGLDMEDAVPAEDPATPNVSFRSGRAEALDLPDASFDGAMMLKSLHHVPVTQMDEALRQVARVLKPGGLLYVSEPVARGPLDEIMRNFHDESEVRAAAQAALARVSALKTEADFVFLSPVSYSSFDNFAERMMTLPTLSQVITPQMREATRAAFAERAAADGSFASEREFHVTVLRAP